MMCNRHRVRRLHLFLLLLLLLLPLLLLVAAVGVHLAVEIAWVVGGGDGLHRRCAALVTNASVKALRYSIAYDNTDTDRWKHTQIYGSVDVSV